MKRREFIKLVGLSSLGAVVPINLLLDGTLEFPTLPNPTGTILQTIDLTEGIRFFLSDELKEVTKKKIYNTVHEYNKWEDPVTGEYDRDFRVVKYYGFRSKNLKNACKELANLITEAHSKATIFGYLMVGGAIPLVDGSYACTTYFCTEKEFNHKYQMTESNIKEVMYV